jgi:hypothetical protein
MSGGAPITPIRLRSLGSKIGANKAMRLEPVSDFGYMAHMIVFYEGTAAQVCERAGNVGSQVTS